jgi:MFS family permease
VLPLALGNFCGPLLLGSLFDTVGRKKMIAGTFASSGVLLLVTAYLFGQGLLSAATQTIAWVVIFLFASAAASSAYLTASEIFPLETRALAIACFTLSAPRSAAAFRLCCSDGLLSLGQLGE